MYQDMTQMELVAEAAEEARRIYEVEFSYYNPYTREICVDNIPYSQQEEFCQMVEDELLLKGEKISRDGVYFKIDRYQRK